MPAILDFFANKQRPNEFEAQLKPHVEHMYRVAYRLTREVCSAEDLVQDAMVHLYAKQTELQQIENLRPWLAKILYNRFIDQYRKDKRNPIVDAQEETVLYQVSDQQLQPEHETEQDLMQERLTVALGNLNDDQREVVVMHDMEGYTLVELETMMSTPLGTLKSRLHRARNNIKAALAMEPSDSLMRLKG